MKGNFAAEIEKTVNKRTQSGPAFFTASGAAVVGSVLSTPIVNTPQVGCMDFLCLEYLLTLY